MTRVFLLAEAKHPGVQGEARTLDRTNIDLEDQEGRLRQQLEQRRDAELPAPRFKENFRNMPHLSAKQVFRGPRKHSNVHQSQARSSMPPLLR
jgi:hypothetical protein